jgi:hypothetical protein
MRRCVHSDFGRSCNAAAKLKVEGYLHRLNSRPSLLLCAVGCDRCDLWLCLCSLQIVLLANSPDEARELTSDRDQGLAPHLSGSCQ